MLNQIVQTVEALHLFFAEWFGGTIANSAENLNILRNTFAADFKMITPTGSLHTREEVITNIAKEWNAIPGLKIWITDVVLLHEDNTTVLALYKEVQLIAGKTNSRISSALFKKQPERLEWLFVQETFCNP